MSIPIVNSYEEQLQLWVAGRSVHVQPSGSADYECCPDFSCCNPKLLQPVEVRGAFQRASQPERNQFLIGFLENLLGHEAYIIASGPPLRKG